MSKTRTALMTLMLMVIIVSAVPAQSQAQVAATVNGQTISLQQVADGALSRFGEDVLNYLIMAAAIEQAAQKEGVTVSAQELEEQCQQAQAQVEQHAPTTGVDFAAWLKMNQMSPGFFRQNIYLSMLLDKMVAPQVNVTDDMVADHYQRNRERLREPDRVHVAHICVSDKDEAEKLRAQIVEGTVSFEDAAKTNSIDPWTKDAGGDFGYIEAGDDPFQKAAFALAADGDISPIVQTRMGYHIIKRLELKPTRVPPFEEIQARLKLSMERERLTRLTSEKKVQIMQEAQIDQSLTVPPYPISDAQRALEPAQDP
ncbi:MAG: hypothetical protein GX358_10040 [candidate division WS1 bacterium]|nr:hypothetical protein [candidate division WS1 bacterium]